MWILIFLFSIFVRRRRESAESESHHFTRRMIVKQILRSQYNDFGLRVCAYLSANNLYGCRRRVHQSSELISLNF